MVLILRFTIRSAESAAMHDWNSERKKDRASEETKHSSPSSLGSDRDEL